MFEFLSKWLNSALHDPKKGWYTVKTKQQNQPNNLHTNVFDQYTLLEKQGRTFK